MKIRNAIQSKKRMLKRLSIIIGILIFVVAAVQIINYAMRPQIQYSLREASCKSSSIDARNKTIGANLNSCVLVISAKNLQNKSVYVDYDGVGGGPAGGGVPLIRIYSAAGKFCYALVSGEGASFPPNATNNLTLRCGGAQKPPVNYDGFSDAKPATIVIGGYSKTTIKIDRDKSYVDPTLPL